MAISRQQLVKRLDVKLILYSMRQKWGVDADFYKVSVGAPNYETGNKNVSTVKYPIRKMITAKASFARKFEYDIGYLAANKNFTYGGFYEPGDRLAVISDEGIPAPIQQRDYFIIGGQRFDIERIDSLDWNAGYILHLRATKKNKRYAQIEKYVWNRVSITQDISSEI